MTLVTPQIEHYNQTQSWIRRMFEAAAELKAKYGADNVYDFSLGNPDVPPPQAVADALHQVADHAAEPLALGYCPNAGRPEVRAALAERVAREQQTDLTGDQIIITSGAAGALNIIFRAVLQSGDQVVTPAPYFVEYGFYAGNYGATLVPVPSKPTTFELDFAALGEAITEKTRAVIINSPNNPTGVVYTQDELEKIAAVLQVKSEQFGRPILLISDEPYRFLAYDDEAVPPLLPVYPYSLVVSSFSKSLSMAGVRIGYIAVRPDMPGVGMLMNGLILANRILGFVNAPVVGQQVVAKTLNAGVDARVYDERRKAMAELLDEAGIVYAMPKGAFYFFPKSPIEDDKAFVDLLMNENIIAVPGSGFGYPGYFRLSYCVDVSIIRSARQALLNVMQKLPK